MRTYESILIVHPEMAGDAYTAIVDKYKGILEELGASIIAIEEWGSRKLAYIVQKQERGNYVLFAYEGKPDSIKEFERRIRIDDKIIKFMTVKLDGGYEPSIFARKSEESEEKAAPAAAPEPAAPAAAEAKAEEAPVEAPATESAEEAPAEEAAAETEEQSS